MELTLVRVDEEVNICATADTTCSTADPAGNPSRKIPDLP